MNIDTITVEKASVQDLSSFTDLIEEHWASFQNKPPTLNENILGNFSVVQAKDKGKIVGYVFYALFLSPYYEEIWSQVDMFYLQPRYRKQGIGKKMFSLVEEDVKSQGASKLISSFNLKQPLEGFYHSMGFKPTHIAVAKEF